MARQLPSRPRLCHPMLHTSHASYATSMTLSIIVAMTPDRVIGRDGQLAVASVGRSASLQAADHGAPHHHGSQDVRFDRPPAPRPQDRRCVASNRPGYCRCRGRTLVSKTPCDVAKTTRKRSSSAVSRSTRGNKDRPPHLPDTGANRGHGRCSLSRNSGREVETGGTRNITRLIERNQYDYTFQLFAANRQTRRRKRIEQWRTMTIRNSSS